MKIETLFTIFVAFGALLTWIVYYRSRRQVISDNKSHHFPEKTKKSTKAWILNSVFQVMLLTITIVVPFNYLQGRPEGNIIIPSETLQLISIVLLVITALAIGAHTLSVYLIQFIEDKGSRLHAENELFHGPISHIPPYLALISFPWIFAIMEKQHPLLEELFLWERIITISTGIIAGISLSAASIIAAQRKVLFRAALINTLIWFVWLTWQFDIAAGPISTFTVAMNFTIIGCNAIFKDKFKKWIHHIYDLPKYD